jgi:hypothetical protein
MKLSLKHGLHARQKALAILTAFVVTGCGSSTKPVTVVPDPSLPVGLPIPSTPGPVNMYSAAQSPGAWTVTLNNTNNTFSYKAITYPSSANQPATGAIQAAGGFSLLGQSGLAFEVPGRAVVVRPGNSAASPVFGAPQTDCYVITGKLRFQYIGMYPGMQTAELGSAGPTLGYGSIVASTDSTGKTWQFENMQGNIVAGPASFTGTCSSTNSQAAISLTGLSVLADIWAPTPALVSTVTAKTQSSIWIGPSGFFAADQSDPTQASPTGASIAGMAEPSSPLSTSALAAAQYRGFLYEPPAFAYQVNPATPAFTVPVAFGQVAASGTTMTGGIFPNDDVTGTPNSDIQISLGNEDGTLNGLYISVKITVLDPAQNCANFTDYSIPVTTGINSQGYITCTFPGVAIAGNPDGNYAIFVNTYNWAARLSGVPMQIYLFQQ